MDCRGGKTVNHHGRRNKLSTKKTKKKKMDFSRTCKSRNALLHYNGIYRVEKERTP